MDLELSVKNFSDRKAVLSVKGRVNAMTAPALKGRIREVVEEGRTEIVCDLTEVGFLDSSGLSALVSGLKATHERGGFLKLAGLNARVAIVFKLTMLDRVFDLYPSVEAALA
ncbi:MAG TPA: STAS domain-containing protein [Anaeromyxobacteraceae bacterium]|nr:STAS domain-containing protein [Anaeromyxobacteraceae bacterium]